MPTIVICSSANFYEHAVAVEARLEAHGFTVILPKSARAMKAAGDYTVRKTWYDNPDDYTHKRELMLAHFDEIARGDAILVLNYEKHGQANYIGPNVLMEMGIALHHHKTIYILNDLPENSPFEEELKGFLPIILHGDLTKIN